jgi:hypothetical protein
VTAATPGDSRSLIEQIRELAEDAHRRAAAWNDQLLAAVDVIRDAHSNGHGVILSVSHVHTTIEAIESMVVPAGTAYVFDRDQIDLAQPAHVQLAPWTRDDSGIPADSYRADPWHAYALPFTPPGAGIITNVTPS